MNVQVQTILFYQITIALWIAFVLGGLYALVHRDAFLKYWSFSWLAVAASLAGALLTSVTGPGDGMMPTLALVAGISASFLHPALLTIATMSTGAGRPSKAMKAAVIAAALALSAVLLTFVSVSGLTSMDQLRVLRAPRFALSGLATLAFAVVFWFRHPKSRTAGGQVTVFFSACYSADLIASALSEAGFWIRLDPTTFLAPALAGFLPLGITAGMFVSVLQEVGAANAAVRESAERLREAERLESVGRLAGGVAHDFNNLLTVINGYADLAIDDLPEESDYRAQMTQVKKAAARGSSLTRQLLAFSRKQVLAPKPLDLTETVRGEAQILRQLVPPGIEWNLALDPVAGCVLADPHQLSQVLINLVINARDACASGGSITVSTFAWTGPDAGAGAADPHAPHGRCAAVSVTDTGIGMDAATKALIFEPFFSTKPRQQGSGLGLASVYGIVSQSGGWITVDSAPGRGSSFTVYLPQSDAAAAA